MTTGRPGARSRPDADLGLEGQIALVTGAGSATGIGFAVAAELGRHGAHVFITSTTSRISARVDELGALGVSASGAVADLTDAAAVDRLLGEVGRVDVCVNNAGMIAVGATMADGPIDAITDEQWHASLERNLTTCFNVTRAVLSGIRGRRYGRIVNVASTSGAVQAFAGDAAYHAAKAGMVGFTRAVALEAAGDNVTVNAVAPGWIATSSQTPHESGAGRATPLHRSGTAAEVAAAIRFLAEPAASYITGQLLVVDGGNSLPEDRTWKP